MGKPVDAATDSASALQAAICSGLVSTRSLRRSVRICGTARRTCTLVPLSPAVSTCPSSTPMISSDSVLRACVVQVKNTSGVMMTRASDITRRQGQRADGTELLREYVLASDDDDDEDGRAH